MTKGLVFVKVGREMDDAGATALWRLEKRVMMFQDSGRRGRKFGVRDVIVPKVECTVGSTCKKR